MERISIIIPVLNEQGVIGSLLDYLLSLKGLWEVIVVDGGSSDQTVPEVLSYPVKLIHSEKGRARQLNRGAEAASGDILYFLHADSFPPAQMVRDLRMAVQQGHDCGSYRLRFDTQNPYLMAFAYFTRFKLLICRGGDQSLFVTREVFRETGGFDNRYDIYEDMEYIRRLSKQYGFKVLPDYVTTSERKYRARGWWKLQFHFAVLHLMGLNGAKPEKLKSYYERHIGMHGNRLGTRGSL